MDTAALLSVAASLEKAVELLRSIAQSARHSHYLNNTPLSLPPSQQGPQQVVIALFDYTSIGLEPWRARGFEVHAYDLRHPPGHTTTAAVLLAAGAAVNQAMNDGATALFIASLQGHADTASVLLAAGAATTTATAA